MPRDPRHHRPSRRLHRRTGERQDRARAWGTGRYRHHRGPTSRPGPGDRGRHCPPHRRPEAAGRLGLTEVVALDGPDPAAAIRAAAHDGVDRVIEVAFSDNADLDAAVVKNQAVIAAYGTSNDRPHFSFWPMLFDNVT